MKNNFNKLKSSNLLFISSYFNHTSTILFTKVRINEWLNRTLDETMSLENEIITKLELVIYKKEKLKESFTWFLNNEINFIKYFKPISIICIIYKDSLKLLVEKLPSYSLKGNIKLNNLSYLFNSTKPLGKNEFGCINFYTKGVYLRNIKFNLIKLKLQIIFNSVPLVKNIIGLKLIFRSYKKYFYNRFYQPNKEIIQLRKLDFISNRNLAIFVFVATLFILFCLMKWAISYKEMDSIIFFITNSTDLETTIDSSDIINKNSSIFLILSNLFNKIPNWVKLIFKLIFIFIFVLKLLGFNSLVEFLFYSDIIYLKILTYILASVAIMFQILNLYLLHKFSLKTIKISEVLPEFLINWLEEFEYFSSSKELIKYYKDVCYREIIVYLLIIIFLTLFY